TVVDLADDYAALAVDAANKDAGITDADDPNAGDPDPVITPPLYGTWHAMTKRLLTARDGSDLPNRGNWVHELNLDPRFRVAAGHQQLAESLLQPAMTSPALRRIVRPRARLMQQLPFSPERPFDKLLERANRGEVSAAPPKVAPPGAQKIDDVAKVVGTPVPV